MLSVMLLGGYFKIASDVPVVSAVAINDVFYCEYFSACMALVWFCSDHEVAVGQQLLVAYPESI